MLFLTITAVAYTFTWQNGRDLASVVKGGVTTTYKYGADGQRIEKKYGNTTYNYYYADGLLVRQTWGTHYIDFLYDESGSPYSLIYDGVQYYYVKNVQGDVIQIRSSYGTLLVEYTYDAWGNVLSITGSNASVLGANNPIRYRGYYLDTETGLYYLQSRYYDPVMRRFINADDVSLLGANSDFASLNLYAYCGNNPVARADDGGEFWNVVIGAAVGAAFSFASEMISHKGNIRDVDWRKVAIGAAEGGISAIVGPIGGMIVSGVASVANDLVDGNTDVTDIAKNALVSVAFSAMSTAVDHGVRTLAVNKLKHSSGAVIKKTVLSIDKTISGSMRNTIKSPQNWSKALNKKVFNNILSQPVSIGMTNGLSVGLGLAKGAIWGF